MWPSRALAVSFLFGVGWVEGERKFQQSPKVHPWMGSWLNFKKRKWYNWKVCTDVTLSSFGNNSTGDPKNVCWYYVNCWQFFNLQIKTHTHTSQRGTKHGFYKGSLCACCKSLLVETNCPPTTQYFSLKRKKTLMDLRKVQHLFSHRVQPGHEGNSPPPLYPVASGTEGYPASVYGGSVFD